MFDRPGLGILGLTATPSRHDGQPLQFTRESYSIGFPDLVSMGVLLRPNVIQVDGGTYDISDIGNDSDALEVFNNTQRKPSNEHAAMPPRTPLRSDRTQSDQQSQAPLAIRRSQAAPRSSGAPR